MGRIARRPEQETQLAMKIGRHLAFWRTCRGLSQRELGRLLGCDHSAVSLWESGRRTPSLANLVAIGHVLSCDTRSWLPGTVEPVRIELDTAAD